MEFGMRSLIYIERTFNRFGDFLGWLSSILFILLLANVVYDVVMRYVFNDVSIAFQEMEWHLFSAVFLLGVPYAIKSGGHVRVAELGGDRRHLVEGRHWRRRRLGRRRDRR